MTAMDSDDDGGGEAVLFNCAHGSHGFEVETTLYKVLWPSLQWCLGLGLASPAHAHWEWSSGGPELIPGSRWHQSWLTFLSLCFLLIFLASKDFLCFLISSGIHLKLLFQILLLLFLEK